MPVTCIVVKCGSRADRDKVSFFNVPKALNFPHATHLNELSAKRRQQWIIAIKRDNLTETKLKYQKVCSKHFMQGKPADLEDVNNPDWTPNQNMGYSKDSAIKRKTDLDRMERVKKRSKLTQQEKDDIFTKNSEVQSNIKNMSMKLQSTSTVLSVSLEKTEVLTAIKNEPPESEIGMADIPNSLDEEIIPDIKDIDIVSHELSEDLIKSETVSENTFENNHSGSVETQVFVKTENIPLIKTENITQNEYLYKPQDIINAIVSRGSSQGVIHNTKGEVDGRYLKYHCDKCKFKTCWSINFKRHKLIHLKPEQIPYFYCYHCPYKCKEKSSLKRHIFIHFKKEQVPFHCYICDFTTLKRNLIIEHFKKHPKHHSKCEETDYKNQLETDAKKQMRYCCEKCTYTSGHSSSFKLHQLTHKTKAEIDDRLLKYRCDKCKFKTYRRTNFKVHKLIHLKPEQILYFYCYHCSYKCKRKDNLQKHIFRHFKNEDVPFHCYICDFTTLKRNLIIEHFKKHPKYHSKCEETDYKNQLETYTKKQMRYCCEKCTYTSGKSSAFKLHQLTHNTRAKILKYRCDKCKFKTYWCNSLKAHKLTHLKPEEIHYFYCYHCSYKSKHKANLQTHIFRHFKNEGVQFHCYICDFITLKRDLIVEHFKTHPKHRSKYDKTEYKEQLENCNKRDNYCKNAHLGLTIMKGLNYMN